MNPKLRTTHLQRKAVIYLRQSTLRQFLQNTESTRQQYSLRKRALSLGWSAEAIVIIDDDIGRSGATATERPGFQRLAEAVTRGEVGAILSLDVSRLARRSTDWHRLLDLCGLTDVIIVDDRAIHDPSDENDRLLLGVKGALSQAERAWIRRRLQSARLHKARRGALRISPPPGYLWDRETQRMRLDPDQQVQQTIRLIFERFRVEGSAYGVMHYFNRHQLQLPTRDRSTRELRWTAPRPSRILGILHNPTYAGAYVYGRRRHQLHIVEGEIRHQSRRVAPKDWPVCLQNHHPAYLRWEEFVSNREKLRENRTHREVVPTALGAAREGSALLQGIVLCGRCGRRMNTVYHGSNRVPRYSCASPVQRGEGPHNCWSTSALAIDPVITEQLLAQFQPEELELALAVFHEARRQADQLQGHWRLRLERAEYEVRLAERRYKSVDPDNRLVARSLESEWNQRLSERADLQTAFAHQRVVGKAELTASDEQRILTLSQNLPMVWNAPSTGHADRKRIARLLIKQVSLTPVDVPDKHTRLRILWHSGAVSELKAIRGAKVTGRKTNPETIAVIKSLIQEDRTNIEIANELQRRGLTRYGGRPWTNAHVSQFIRRYRFRPPQPCSRPSPDRRGDGLYSIRGVAREFGVTRNIVQYWVRKGLLVREEGGGRGTRQWFKLDAGTRERLEEACRDGQGPRSVSNSSTASHKES